MSANDVHCKNCNAPPPTLPPIFHQCPSLKAAHATKTGVMRSEARENLSIVCCVLLRNIDLTTFAILETRTLTEIYRFIAHALAAEGKGRRKVQNEAKRHPSHCKLFISHPLMIFSMSCGLKFVKECT